MTKHFLQFIFLIILWGSDFKSTKSFIVYDSKKFISSNEKLSQHCLNAENFLGSFFDNGNIYEKYINAHEKLKDTYKFFPEDNLSILRNNRYIEKIYFNSNTKTKERLFICDISCMEIITMYSICHEIYSFIKNASINDFVTFFDYGYKFFNNPIEQHDVINILDNSYVSYTLCLLYHRFFSRIWTPEEQKNKKKFLFKALTLKYNLENNSIILSILKTNILLWEDVFETMKEYPCSIKEKQSFFTLGHLLASINSLVDDE